MLSLVGADVKQPAVEGGQQGAVFGEAKLGGGQQGALFGGDAVEGGQQESAAPRKFYRQVQCR